MTDLASLFGQIDIYLFDQWMRDRITPGMRILDPLKTTVVQDQRAMTTWVLRKSLAASR